jgi:hypothetical protein
MSELDNTETTRLRPWETEVHLGPTGTSEELARRLFDAGASDDAVDAAGGHGTAARLRAEQLASHAA